MSGADGRIPHAIVKRIAQTSAPPGMWWRSDVLDRLRSHAEDAIAELAGISAAVCLIAGKKQVTFEHMEEALLQIDPTRTLDDYTQKCERMAELYAVELKAHGIALPALVGDDK